MNRKIRVTEVRSRAFPNIVPSISGFDHQPVTAYRVEYQGAIMTFHDVSEKDRYVNAKLVAGAVLI